jgi:hypothetical protein
MIDWKSGMAMGGSRVKQAGGRAERLVGNLPAVNASAENSVRWGRLGSDEVDPIVCTTDGGG